MNDTLAVAGTLIEVFRSRGIGPAVSADLDPTQGLIKYIDQAQQSIVIGIYSLASQPIVDAFIRAKNRGVVIYGIADSKQWSGSKALNDKLVAAGIDLMRAIRQHACLHIKVLVIDDHIVTEGSFNFTNNAEEHNDEVLFVIDSAEAAKVCKDQIDQARALNQAEVKSQLQAMLDDHRDSRTPG